MNRYEFVRQIGKGSFGSVWLANRKVDGAQFVVKQMAIKNISSNELDACQNEVRLLAQLEHPGIVSMIESFMDQSKSTLCIVMTYCEGGDLSHFLDGRKKVMQSASQSKNAMKHHLLEKEIWYFFIQVSLSLLFMHDLNILHRDLKTQNIFLKNGFLQLGDFGISKSLNTPTDFAATCIGTPYYMSPELFKNEKYNFKSDIWALGCILYELTTFKHAFDANTLNNLAAKIIKGQISNIPPQYSNELRDLISLMLSTNPSQRPSLREILTMPFIKVKLKKFVHTIIKHRELYRTQDVINFEKQITSLGCADMLKLDDPAPEIPIKPSNNQQQLSAVQAQQRAMELLREEERERAKMGDALSQLKAQRARGPSSNNHFVMPPPMPVQVASTSDKRRSNKDVYPAPSSNHAAIADLRRVEERRREREDLAKREEMQRRRDEAARMAAERERLREIEQRKTEQLQRMHREQALRRRQYNDNRAKQERREQEAKMEFERMKVERERIQRHLRDIESQRNSRPSSAQPSIQETIQSPITINQIPTNQPPSISSQQDERDVESLNDRDRVLARKEKVRLEREAAERSRLNQARADYDAERARAAQLNHYAISGYPNGQAPSASNGHPTTSSSASPAQPPRVTRVPEPVEPPTEELVDAVEIEELEEELQNYDRKLQTLRNEMQVTAIIDEISESDDEAENGEDSEEEGDEDLEEEDISDPHAHLFVTVEERLRMLGKECLRLCGKPVFIAGYDWLAALHESGRRGELEESELLAEAVQHMGEHASHWKMLDQLLFMESHLDDNEQ